MSLNNYGLTSWKFKLIRRVNCFQNNWALVQLFKAVYCLNKAAEGEPLDLYLEIVFKKILFLKKESCILKEKWKAKIKFSTFVYICYTSLFVLQLSFACNPAFNLNMGKKPWAHVLFSSCFWHYRKHPSNDNKICPLPSPSNSTFMTDSQFLGKIQIWQNFNEHRYYLTSTKSVICQIDTNCDNNDHQLEIYSENINQSDIILYYSENNCRAH